MRILMVDTAFLGDLLLATPLIRGAAEAAGGAVDLITSPAGAQAVRHHPLVDAVQVLRKRDGDGGLGGFRRARAWIRQRRPDVALLPRRSVRSLLLAWAAGVPRRVGFARPGPARLLLTDTVAFVPGRHQVERNLDLLRPLGVDPDRCGLPGHPLEVFPSDVDRAEAVGWLAERGLADHGSFYVVAPGSAWATKRWPAERFATLAACLSRERPVLVMGGPSEAAMAAAIQRRSETLVGTGRVHALTHLGPVASVPLLARAAALVANDSGALHLGQAAGTPLVALYGPTVPAQGFAPRGEGHRILGVAGLECRPCGRHGAARCPLGHWRCMLDLPLEEVLAAVRQVERPAA